MFISLCSTASAWVACGGMLVNLGPAVALKLLVQYSIELQCPSGPVSTAVNKSYGGVLGRGFLHRVATVIPEGCRLDLTPRPS